MTVVRVENSISYVRLQLDGRNVNDEINAILTPTKRADGHSNKPVIDPRQPHYVQLTTVDAESECFHVLLMQDCLVTILNELKDWNASRRPFIAPPQPGMLVCAQHEADDLWYRAWIKSVTGTGSVGLSRPWQISVVLGQGYRVYFVDFGNEEIVKLNRLNECPNEIRTLPWLSLQIKLANVTLSDDERLALFQKFEADRLEMSVARQEKEVYTVELTKNGKSITEHVLELRKALDLQKLEVASEPAALKKRSRTPLETAPSTTTSTTEVVTQPPGFAKAPVVNEQKNDTNVNETLVKLLAEQRRQNQLLDRVVSAINTTNALLTQLVQR